MKTRQLSKKDKELIVILTIVGLRKQSLCTHSDSFSSLGIYESEVGRIVRKELPMSLSSFVVDKREYGGRGFDNKKGLLLTQNRFRRRYGVEMHKYPGTQIEQMILPPFLMTEVKAFPSQIYVNGKVLNNKIVITVKYRENELQLEKTLIQSKEKGIRMKAFLKGKRKIDDFLGLNKEYQLKEIEEKKQEKKVDPSYLKCREVLRKDMVGLLSNLFSPLNEAIREVTEISEEYSIEVERGGYAFISIDSQAVRVSDLIQFSFEESEE